MKKVTIQDIAAAAGVSNATVSRALCGKPGAGDETRERVLRLCREMGYVSNYVPSKAFVPRSGLIGLIMPSLSDPAAGMLASEIEAALQKQGFVLTLACSQGDRQKEAALFDRMLAHRVDGMLLVPADAESRGHLAAQLERVQTVFLCENLLHEEESYVAADARGAALMGMEYLSMLGHEKILLFGCRKGITAHRLFAEGYLAACRKRSMSPICTDNLSEEDSVAEGMRLAAKLLTKPQRAFTAMLCASENMAIGALLAAQKAALHVPEALSVLAYGGTPLSANPFAALSMLQLPVEKMAAAAVEILLDMLAQPVDGYCHRIYRPELIERLSCAKRQV